MIERIGDIWDASETAIMIPTNGEVRRDGCAVMGAGMALQAKKRIPGIDRELANCLVEYGNRVIYLTTWHGKRIFSFPTKHTWRDLANRDLIRDSCMQLRGLADGLNSAGCGLTFALPRVGCGVKTGQLRWDDIHPILADALPGDAFVVYTM